MKPVTVQQKIILDYCKDSPRTIKEIRRERERKVTIRQINILISNGYLRMKEDRFYTVVENYKVVNNTAYYRKEDTEPPKTKELIPVNPMEFSLIRGIQSGINTPILLHKHTGYSYTHIQNRLFYFAAKDWIKKEDKQYFLNVDPTAFEVYDNEDVLSFRTSNKLSQSFFSIEHITEGTIKMIKDMVRRGIRRSEIARILKMTKRDVLNVICQSNIRSVEVKDDDSSEETE